MLNLERERIIGGWVYTMFRPVPCLEAYRVEVVQVVQHTSKENVGSLGEYTLTYQEEDS